MRSLGRRKSAWATTSAGTLGPTDRAAPGSHSAFLGDSHHLSGGEKSPGLLIARSLLPIMFFLQMETCTLAEISEDKLMLRQRPFNQEAVTAFFPPSPALVWGRRRLPQGHRTTSYHRHRPIPWPCVLGYLPPAGSHLWGEGRTNRSLVVQGVKQLLEAAGGTDPPSHRRSLG